MIFIARLPHAINVTTGSLKIVTQSNPERVTLGLTNRYPHVCC
jgi:hypothetical protein